MKKPAERHSVFSWPDESRVRTMTVMFTDMAASSRFAEMYGARAALSKRKRHNRMLIPMIDRHRGTLVEAFGDSLLAVFEQPDDAARCAISMQRNLAKFNRARQFEQEGLQIHIRVGLHTGRLILCQYDRQLEVAGRAVNVAARVESGDGRKTDQILLSETTQKELQDERRFRTEPVGNIRARGVRSLKLHRLQWNAAPAGPNFNPHFTTANTNQTTTALIPYHAE